MVNCGVSALAALVAAACMPASALAAGGYPAKVVLSTGKTIVGETIHYPATGPAHITATVVTLAPGGKTVLHRHGVPLFGYILKGTLTVDYGAKGRHTYRPGDAFMEAMGVNHRGMNLGKVPVEILAVYMGAAGSQNVIVAKQSAARASATK